MNMKELTHSEQQPQAPQTHKKKPTIRIFLLRACKNHYPTQQPIQNCELGE